MHIKNQKQIIERIRIQFGEHNFDEKLNNFIEVGPSPFSVISYHNAFYQQAKNSFIQGSYYPALTAASALGERILNHLIIDLREYFKQDTDIYKKIYRQESFQGWSQVINILSSWGVFQHENVKREFLALMPLRMQSLHYNPETYTNVREDALKSLKHLSEIINLQFGFACNQHWMIAGTSGKFFIKKHSEKFPFILKYYLPQSPLVGPYHSWDRGKNGSWLIFDWVNYPHKEITDEEFANMYNNKEFTQLAPTTLPCGENILVYELIGNQIRILDNVQLFEKAEL